MVCSPEKRKLSRRYIIMIAMLRVVTGPFFFFFDRMAKTVQDSPAQQDCAVFTYFTRKNTQHDCAPTFRCFTRSNNCTLLSITRAGLNNLHPRPPHPCPPPPPSPPIKILRKNGDKKIGHKKHTPYPAQKHKHIIFKKGNRSTRAADPRVRANDHRNKD